jgi:hypothetical protein
MTGCEDRRREQSSEARAVQVDGRTEQDGRSSEVGWRAALLTARSSGGSSRASARASKQTGRHWQAPWFFQVPLIGSSRGRAWRHVPFRRRARGEEPARDLGSEFVLYRAPKVQPATEAASRAQAGSQGGWRWVGLCCEASWRAGRTVWMPTAVNGATDPKEANCGGVPVSSALLCRHRHHQPPFCRQQMPLLSCHVF